MKQERFALVDCNNFYVSCERVFNPKLKNKPVMVLSNNDGCVVARSQEVKDLGIKMGTPAFKCQSFIKKHSITVYSSNFSLYGDMSARVMHTLQQHAPEVEIYSIDEAFLRLTHLARTDYTAYGQELKKIIKQWTGIPICVGIGPTKTLAKVANKIAKKHAMLNGVFDISSVKHIDALLNNVPVQDIWGIGRQYTHLLQRNGIHTAKDLKYAHDTWVRKHMTIVGLRTVWELRGIACLSLEQHHPPKKNIAHTRSFGRRLTKLTDIQEAVADYAAKLGYKLRKQHSRAHTLYVFIMTSRFITNKYYNSTLVQLDPATAYTPDLIKHAQAAIKKIYRTGFQYKKAGILAMDLVPDAHEQLHAFNIQDRTTQHAVMHNLDAINKKWGRNTVYFAAQGTKKDWIMKREKKSPAFTTRWEEIPVIRVSNTYEEK